MISVSKVIFCVILASIQKHEFMTRHNGGNIMENNKKTIIIAAVAGVALLAGILVGIGLSSFLRNDTVAKVEETPSKVTVEEEVADATANDATDTTEDVSDASEDEEDVNTSDDAEATDSTADKADAKTTEKADSSTTAVDPKADETTTVTWPGLSSSIPYNAAAGKVMADETGKFLKYEIIENDISWSAAFKDCLERGGHLLWINDMDEYNKISEFIFNEKCDNDIFYLGAMRDDKSDKYFWVNAKKDPIETLALNNEKCWSYKLWAVGEPSFKDNHDNEEMFLTTYYSKADEKWMWSDNVDDLPGNANVYLGRTAYICEYE